MLARIALLLLLLWPPSIARAEFRILHSGVSDRLIVFVHGLFGDPEQTFRADDADKSWPDLISEDSILIGDLPLSSYAVATLSYPASSSDRLTISDVSLRLLQEIQNSAFVGRYKHIAFVAHSLGGIVLKQMLLHASRAKGSGLYEKTVAVFLIAVPSTGSDVAGLASVLPKMARGTIVVDLKPIEDNTYLQNLEADWVLFMEARNPALRPSVFCMFERKTTYGIMVVPQSRSVTRCDGPGLADNKDHIGIVKPATARDFVYDWVRGNLARAAWIAPSPIGPPIDFSTCVKLALDGLKQVSPFSVEGGVRCEGAGLGAQGQKRSDYVVYSVPPNYRLLGTPEVNQLSSNNGQTGPVEYEPLHDARLIKVPVSCESPSRPFGPGAWMNIRVSGHVERVVTQEERANANAECSR